MKENFILTKETIRDFCGSLTVTDRNTKLLNVLPMAIDNYSKMSDVSKDSIYESIIDCLNLPDYRTGIIGKDVLSKLLLDHEDLTEEEIASLCDVIYVDAVSASLELEADKLL